MTCEQCVKENKKSFVYPGLSHNTAMYFQPFYDEQGMYHNHDGNIRTTMYACSNGHNWKESSRGSCPCGWQG